MNLPVTLLNNTIADANDVMENFDLLMLLLNGLPNGTVLNGKILPTVSSNNLTLTLLTYSGATPSSADPVYVKINGEWYKIDSALTVTKAAGTDWGGAGVAAFAAKEIDWFAYLILRTDAGKPATNQNIDIGISRLAHPFVYSEFSSTTTDEKHLALGTAGTPTSTDNVAVIGRFAATLSAAASYNWSVPSYTTVNLIQGPIRETRWLTWLPTYTGSGSLTYGTVTTSVAKYMIRNKTCMYMLRASGTTGGVASTDVNFTLPISQVSTYLITPSAVADGGNLLVGIGFIDGSGSTVSVRKSDSSNWGLGASRVINSQGNYEIA